MSIGTVSNVLNGRSKENYPKVAKRAKRIRALAEKMGYRPNSAAKVMRSGRFGNAAYVWQGDWLYAPKTLLRGLSRRLADLDMHLSMAELPRPTDEDQRVPKLMRELATDGLLVDRTITFTDEQMAMIERCRVPVVWLNADAEMDCSYPDDHGAAVAAVELLRGLGHRRIAYFQMMRGRHYSYRVRERGYLDAMAASGFAPRSLAVRKRGARWDDEHIIDDLHALIREFKPTAMLCFGELGANAAMVAAARQGLRVPEDLSIVVHHPGPARAGGLAATTMISDFMEVGVQAVNMLQAKLEHGQPMPSCAVPHRVVEGQTVAPRGRSRGPASEGTR
ncbi:MAG: LacI family DNA-binding transcriptional regulator [Kiritimatiellae bacterium]|nr:LacI family DNA-binding transcriptional regulator [Kiritimatiellia bacterium]